MAAPSGTKWGNKVNDRGRIGIAVSRSYSNSTVKVTLAVWFWSKYSVSDSGNTLYLNNKSTSATIIKKDSKSIYTTHNSGSGWSTNNQKKIYDETYTLDRYTTKRTINCAAKLVGVDWVGGTMTVGASYTIEPLPTRTITFNMNGGSGGPGNASVFYEKSYTIPDSEPTKKNAEFIYWEDEKGVKYAPGDVIKNVTANKTLTAAYASISVDDPTTTIYLKYNSNGGTTVSSQSATVNKGESANFKINEGPTREGYRFENWNSAKDGNGVTYSPNNSYAFFTTTTLYAQWTPRYHTVEYYISEGNPWKQNGVAVTQKKETDKSIQVLGPPEPLEGFVFRHWNLVDPDAILPVSDETDTEEDLKQTYTPGQFYSYNKAKGKMYLVAEWREQSGILFCENGNFECLELKEIDYPKGQDYKKNEWDCSAFYSDGPVIFSNFIENDDGTISFLRKTETLEDGTVQTKEVSMSAYFFKEVD